MSITTNVNTLKLATSILNKKLREWGISKSTPEALDLNKRLLEWLENFAEHEQSTALSIFEKIQFITEVKKSKSIKWIAASIKKQLGAEYVKLHVFSIGDSAGSSGGRLLYDLLNELDLPQDRAPATITDDVIKSNNPILLVDDIIGSGKQAARFIENKFKLRLESNKTTIYATLVAKDMGIKHIQDQYVNLTIFSYQILTESDRAFHKDSKLFPNPSDRQTAKKLAQKYGQSLYDHALGYEDSQLLIAFEWNTPNNTLPIIWAGPKSESAPDVRWTPLFPRHKVSSKKFPISFSSSSKRITSQKNRSHYNALPCLSPQVDEIYVNPNHALHWINSAGENTEEASEDFIAAARACINSEKLLLLYGPYGCGKTFLAKFIEFNGILGTKESIVSITTQALLQATRQSPGNYIEEVLTENTEGLVLDALDVLLVDNEDHNKELELVAKLVQTALERGVCVLLTLRQSDALEYESPIIKELASNLFKFGVLQLPAIKIEHFDKPQIEAWLKKFGNWKEARHQLSTEIIKQTHKRLLKAAGNPLFLYILADAYQKDIDNIETIYDIYESFIKSTISGRFRSEKSVSIRENTWKLADRYKSLLEKIAKEIARTTQIGKAKELREYYRNHSNEDPSLESSDQLIDPNTITHTISEDQLSSILPPELRSLKNEDVKPGESAKLQILNNYFFTRLDNQIGFRDNNVLFFLIAQQLFRSINEIATNPYSPNMDDLLLDIATTKAHPQAIEILIRKIKHQNETFQDQLLFAIETLIRQEKIIQLTPQSLDQLSGAVINRDVILSIVLLQIKNTSYRNIPYFISRLSWLTNAIKNQDTAYRFLVARFFRNLTLHEIEFRRVNCDDYNFQGSTLIDAKFIQTKLFETTFRSCKFSNVDFTLCDFGSSKFPSIFDLSGEDDLGDIQFSFCTAGAIKLRNLKGRTKIFITNCEIGSLDISTPSKAESFSLELHIKNSSIDQISFEKVYVKAGSTVKNSQIKKIYDKGSGGKFLTSRSLSPLLQKARTGTGSIEFKETQIDFDSEST